MYVYQRATGENFYVVGFFDPAGKWHSESDQGTKEEAASRVHWLNGGSAHTGAGTSGWRATGSEGYGE